MKLEDTTNIYVGLYKGIPISVSSHKKSVKNYMKDIRQLNKNEYTIEREEVSEDNYFEYLYEDLVLTQFYDLYIPLIDIKIIEMEYKDLSHDFFSYIEKIKYFTFLFNNIDNKEIVDQSIELMKNLDVYTKGKKFDKLNKIHMLSHPIMSCDMYQYFMFMKNYKDYKDLKKRYKELCDND